jgi:hypothetical protein
VTAADFGPDECAERDRLDHIAQQHDEDRIAKERELEDRLAKLEAKAGTEGSADDLSASETRGRYAGCGVFQVVMSDVMKPGFKAWLEARDMHLYVIPVVDDLPTFGVAPNHPARGER